MNMEKYREGPPTSTMRFLLCNKYCRVSMWDVQTKGCGDASNFSQEATFQQVFIGLVVVFTLFIKLCQLVPLFWVH